MRPSGYFNLMLIFISLSTFATIIVLFKTKTHKAELESLNVYQKLFVGHGKFYSNEHKRSNIKIVDRNKFNLIECDMFEKSKTTCLKHGNQIYLPMDYIKEKFDVIFFISCFRYNFY